MSNQRTKPAGRSDNRYPATANGLTNAGGTATEVHSLAETQKLGSTEFPRRTDSLASTCPAWRSERGVPQTDFFGTLLVTLTVKTVGSNFLLVACGSQEVSGRRDKADNTGHHERRYTVM
jgi:hypothetical protein